MRAARSRWAVHVAWVLVAVVAAVATWAATRTVMAPPELDQDVTEERATYTLAEGTLSDEESLVGTAEYRASGRATTALTGVVTGIEAPHGDGGRVEAGDVVLTVDLQPVIVAQGEVPMFRDLTAGVKGADVAQLRAFLGVGDGDEFDDGTEEAVRAWQQETGQEETGTVSSGRIIFVPALPAPARVPDEVQVGDVLGGGVVVLETFDARPDVFLRVESGPGAVTPGLVAAVEGAADTGVLEAADPDEQGLPRLQVIEVDGGSVCAGACAEQAAVPGPSAVPVTVQRITPVSGVLVPAAAVAYGPDGGAVVVDAATEEPIPVTVVSEAGGEALIEGAEVGTVVELFPDADGGTG